MPYKYIGKTSDQCGKTLWEILGNLKNFGVGRIVYRNLDVAIKYPNERSWMKILKVETLPNRPNESRKVICLVEKVHRGHKYDGHFQIESNTYKPDFRLVPKHEEAKFCKYAEKKPLRLLPRSTEMLPVMKELIKRQHKATSIPLTDEDFQCPLLYDLQGYEYVYRVAEKEETPDPELVKSLEFGLGITEASRLYKTRKMIEQEKPVQAVSPEEAKASAT